MFGVCGKVTIAPDGETLTRRTICLRPRNSSTAVFESEGFRTSVRSSIIRCSLRGIIDPERKKPDATLPSTTADDLSQPRLRIGLQFLGVSDSSPLCRRDDWRSADKPCIESSQKRGFRLK